MGTEKDIRVRNVGIVGHGGVGKTTLIEHMLHAAGAIPRIGRVEDGSTVCDYLEEEKSHGHSISLKLVHLDWQGIRIHLVDHPGYADFIGAVASTMPLLDAVVICVDATTGPQPGTDAAFHEAQADGTPRAFFVNKLDRDGAHFDEIVENIRETYGRHCVPLELPHGEGPGLTEVVNLVADTHADFDEKFEGLRVELSDVVAEMDDALLEKYLETGAIGKDEFSKALHNGIKSGRIVPILAGSVDKDIGVRELLDLIVDVFPAPHEHPVFVHDREGKETALTVGADEPFLGQVFRTVVDPFVGQITLFRVLTGTLKTDSEFMNITRSEKERTGKIVILRGKEQFQVDQVGPGDLAAMTKLKNTRFGDTIGSEDRGLVLPDIALPEAVVRRAIAVHSRQDEDKLGEALNRMAEEDPTFRHYRDPVTEDHIIQGMGDIHLNVVLERIKRRYGIDAETFPPHVAYKETIRGKAEKQGKYKKQSGGHGQYGDVHIRIEPTERGHGYEFVNAITGGVIPKQYIPAVDKGCQETLAQGIVAGYPLVDIRVELFFGSYHDVDSSEMAFKMAAAMALKEAVKAARPGLLEPIVNLEITVPDDCMGDVTGDLSARRGRILGMEPAGRGRQLVRAQAPESEILTYSATLRSITHGRGAYTLQFSHYEDMPEPQMQAIIDAQREEMAHAK